MFSDNDGSTRWRVSCKLCPGLLFLCARPLSRFLFVFAYSVIFAVFVRCLRKTTKKKGGGVKSDTRKFRIMPFCAFASREGVANCRWKHSEPSDPTLKCFS